MKLYVVQHGEAVPKQRDPDRPLSEKGIADIERLTDFMKHAEISVHRIYHSGKTRSLQSAETLVRGVRLQGDLEQCDALNPSDPPDIFIKQIIERREDVLVVGHLPHVSKLVSALVTRGHGPAVVDFQPGCAVCLEFCNEDDAWKITWMTRPELLHAQS